METMALVARIASAGAGVYAATQKPPKPDDPRVAMAKAEKEKRRQQASALSPDKTLLGGVLGQGKINLASSKGIGTDPGKTLLGGPKIGGGTYG